MNKNERVIETTVNPIKAAGNSYKVAGLVERIESIDIMSALFSNYSVDNLLVDDSNLMRSLCFNCAYLLDCTYRHAREAI